MSKFRKIPVTIEASQWFKNGDHPLDHDPIGIDKPTSMDLAKYDEYKTFEGKVVRYFRRPDVPCDSKCKHCGETMHVHGWIDTLEGGHIVCPGDWIITGVKGERYPCKPEIFAVTYDEATKNEAGRSVAMPERKEPPTYEPDTHVENYEHGVSDGWNACLEEIAKLNELKS